MNYADIPEFVVKVRSEGSVAARALEYCILTAARAGEVRGATWQEIDIEARLWIVPAGRMKAHKEHRVPLSERAMEILEAARPDTLEGLIFQGRRGKPLHNTALAKCAALFGQDA